VSGGGGWGVAWGEEAVAGRAAHVAPGLELREGQLVKGAERDGGKGTGGWGREGQVGRAAWS
jgi:hypothetical protein